MNKPLLLTCLLTACAPQVVPVSVSSPKVWGDDHVLASLAERQREVRALAPGAAREGALLQESLAVRHESSSRVSAAVDLDPDASPGADDEPAAPSHPRGCGCARCARLVAVQLQPPLGPSSAELLETRLDLADLVAATERVATGDAQLLDRRSRAVLLRFDVCFNAPLDLGERRRFVVVTFAVRARARCTVYRLAPEVRAIASDEELVDSASRELSLEALGTFGGVGLTGGWDGKDRLARRFEAVLATPLQYGIYRGAGATDDAPFTFAFAFGPRRRIVERSLLNPARWFGDPVVVTHELAPGPRPCEAVLVFQDVDPDQPLDLTVSVFCDGELVAEEALDATRALGRPLDTFAVRCPAGVARGTRRITLVPGATTDVLVDAGEGGAVFSQASRLLVGPVALPAEDVQLVGRGRLAARVRPTAALLALVRAGATEVPCRVLTPDEPDFELVADLSGGGK